MSSQPIAFPRAPLTMRDVTRMTHLIGLPVVLDGVVVGRLKTIEGDTQGGDGELKPVRLTLAAPGPDDIAPPEPDVVFTDRLPRA